VDTSAKGGVAVSGFTTYGLEWSGLTRERLWQIFEDLPELWLHFAVMPDEILARELQFYEREAECNPGHAFAEKTRDQVRAIAKARADWREAARAKP
jgi:hypothetical protein